MTEFDPGRAVLPGGVTATVADMEALLSKPGAHFRQGDVLAVFGKSIPPKADPVARERGSVVLAHGEVTGHMHQLRGPNVAMFRDGAGHEYVRVSKPESLGHEEHSAVTLPVGDYELGQQVRYQPERLLREAD
jgi:hypothetical protein